MGDHLQVGFLPSESHLDDAGIAAHREGAPVAAVDERLDAAYCPHLEVSAGGDSVEGRYEGKPEPQSSIGDEHISGAAPRSQITGGEPEDVMDDPIHLPDASESGGAGDHRHGQIGLVEEPPGEMGSPGSGHERGGGTHVPFEEPTELAGAVADPTSQHVLVVAIEVAVGYEAHGRDHRRRSFGEGIGPNVAIRAAAQARPVPGGLGRDG
jgi:hypothetical protein